ncbi:MAG TPA: adenylate/guanylate cyclase domain-containing protein, partial [Gaiellaceae bacterium]|nr:adenylate/guanylate cyclase domain-containing protein [Gaiellaceae bacterium]
ACGFALRQDARRAADIADERQERRVVTVLFADLAGSTALGELIDPEDFRELLGELFELINTEVERFGGMTEKFAGDAVLAVFGVPQAHEDDPERAVRAALAVRDGFDDFIESVRGRHGAQVGLRIGINTGNVVAGRDAATRGELIVSGDTVNVAARLQQHAEPGEVLVGERTQAATARTIAYRQHEDLDAKGKSTPVSAWVALHTATKQPAATPRGFAGVTSPLVGRDEELAVLSAVAARVERELAPQLVTVFGPAGVGKSRLLTELVERLSPAHVLVGRCLPYGEGITYWPLAEVAKAHAGILDNDPAETGLTKLRSAIESVVSDEHVEHALNAAAWTIGFSLPETPVMDADPREAVHRLEEGWTRYLAALGSEQIAVVAVEDVHWASGPLLDLIEQLAERLTGTRVLLVCTARLELLEMRPTWGAGKQNATTLTLTPLAPAQAAELVSSLLGEASVPEAVRDRVLAHAEGNPFYLEEMLNMLIDQGLLERRNGDWVSSARLADVSIPDSVHGVIAARVDLLDAASRDALRRCSVVGRSFWPAAVGVDEHVVDSLRRTGLVSDSPDSAMGGMREFAFKHALTQDVVYSTLPRPERRDLHGQVAEWIREVAGDRDVEAAELAAYHYGQALAYGEDNPEVSRHAVETLLMASEAASSRADFGAARVHVERALEFADDDTRPGARLAHARLNYLEGDFESTLEELAMLEAELAPDDAALRSDVLAWRSRTCWLTGRWDESLSSAKEAVAALYGLPESPQLARALARLSQIEMLRHEVESIDHAKEAIAVARRVDDAFAEVNARINLLTQEANSGHATDPDEFLEIIDRAAEIGVYDEAYRAIVNFIWATPGYVPVDRVEEVVATARQQVSVSPPASIGDYVELSVAVWLHLPTGRWEQIDEALVQVQSSAASTHMVELGLIGGMALRRGDPESAAAEIEELRAMALESAEPHRIAPMICVVAPWLAVTGREDELDSLVDEAFTALDGRWPSVQPAVPALRALASTGDAELLRRALESMGRTPREAQTAKLGTALTAGAGFLALMEGRAGEAVERL